MKGMTRIAPIVVLALAAVAGNATTITFEGTLQEGAKQGFIANPLANLYWVGFLALDSQQTAEGSGYYNSAISPKTVGLAGSSTVKFGDSANPFTLNSMYMTAAYNDGLMVDIKGMLKGEVLFNQIVTIDTNAPTLVKLDWEGVDWVTMTPTGGKQTTASTGYGTYFALDNIVTNERIENSVPAVPEPATIGLAAIGLAAAIRRRRR